MVGGSENISFKVEVPGNQVPSDSQIKEPRAFAHQACRSSTGGTICVWRAYHHETELNINDFYGNVGLCGASARVAEADCSVKPSQRTNALQMLLGAVIIREGLSTSVSRLQQQHSQQTQDRQKIL